MIFAHILLPTILFVICKSHPYETQQQRRFDDYADLANFKILPSETTKNYQNSVESANIIGQNDLHILLNQYRQIIAMSLVKLKDSCRVYDFLLDNDQNWVEENEVQQRDNNDLYLSSLMDVIDKDKQHANFILPIETGEQNNMSAQNVFTNFVQITSQLKDVKLDTMIRLLLHEKCCKEEIDNFATNPNRFLNCLEKRNQMKKVKFHSWGGKRDGGKEISKVVIRTPFRPWGGKRTNNEQEQLFKDS